MKLLSVTLRGGTWRSHYDKIAFQVREFEGSRWDAGFSSLESDSPEIVCYPRSLLRTKLKLIKSQAKRSADQIKAHQRYLSELEELKRATEQAAETQECTGNAEVGYREASPASTL